MSALHEAVEARAIPILEGLAEVTDEQRERFVGRRFNRDEPLPYASSTESEDDEDAIMQFRFGPNVSSILARFGADRDRPLDEEERYSVARHAQGLRNLYGAARAFHLEKNRERILLNLFVYSDAINQKGMDWWRSHGGEECESILIRHRIKQRWQRLGIWNEDWGIPRPNRVSIPIWNEELGLPVWQDKQASDKANPKDNAALWRWPWQEVDKDEPAPHSAQPRHGERCPKITGERLGLGWQAAPADATLATANTEHPVVRALRFRWGEEHHEGNGDKKPLDGAPRPQLPRLPPSRMAPGASAAEAEAFIMSRPWFAYELDVSEEVIRRERLPYWARQGLDDAAPANGVVADRWRERGDWDERWNKRFSKGKPAPAHIAGEPGWRWPHGDAEDQQWPEADPYELLNDGAMDFTPSEADALDAIPPTSPRPDTRRGWFFKNREAFVVPEPESLQTQPIVNGGQPEQAAAPTAVSGPSGAVAPPAGLEQRGQPKLSQQPRRSVRIAAAAALAAASAETTAATEEGGPEKKRRKPRSKPSPAKPGTGSSGRVGKPIPAPDYKTSASKLIAKNSSRNARPTTSGRRSRRSTGRSKPT